MGVYFRWILFLSFLYKCISVLAKNIFVKYLNWVKSIFALSGSIFADVSSFFPPFTNVNEPPEAAQMCPQRKSKDFCFQKIIGEKCYAVSSLVWSMIMLMQMKSWQSIFKINISQLLEILLGNEVWLVLYEISKGKLETFKCKIFKERIKNTFKHGQWVY